MFEYDYEEDRNFFQRYRGLVLISAILLLGAGVFFAARFLSRNSGGAVRRDEIMVVTLPPPPPPPPKLQPTPTPPQQQPTPEQQQEQKMVEQQPVQNEKKPETPHDKQPDAPAPLGTSITGPGGGPDLGLGSGLGGGGGYGTGGGGSKYGWYASEVQNRIRDAVTSNSHTRFTSMNVIARIWLDPAGHITKARVSGGDPALDATVEKDVLPGLQIADGPPADMPQPIVMKIALERPR